jgi:RNA polymerase sigma-70 factor (ECF subfamily)
MSRGHALFRLVGMTDPFVEHRPRLLALAYRMLGSLAEAEDAVQDTHEKWLRTAREEVLSPRAWLEKTLTNRCLDVLGSARLQREEYVGTWLPEPVATDTGPLAGEKLDTISLAFLTLLERLSPLERAVFVLAEAFDYSTPEIAKALGREEPAVRQLLHRAREHVHTGRPRFSPTREAHETLLTTFLAAVAEGDVAKVESLLASDAVLRTDAGGKARAALNEIAGANRVARGLIGISRKGAPPAGFAMRELNGAPMMLLLDEEGCVTGVFDVETDGEHIFTVSVVINPDKLKHVSPPS